MKKRTQTEFQLPSARLLRQAPRGDFRSRPRFHIPEKIPLNPPFPKGETSARASTSSITTIRSFQGEGAENLTGGGRLTDVSLSPGARTTAHRSEERRVGKECSTRW